MSNRYIGDTPFLDLLPDSISSDETVRHAAEALERVINRANRCIPHVLIFARLARDSGFINPVPMLPPMERLAELSGGLDELDPEMLDLLAWQLHVEGYEGCVNLQAKRELIQASLLLHRRHGTPWSVRYALETAMRVDTVIRQWFEYGGKPYFFRVRMDVTGTPVDIVWLESTMRIILQYKNVRSWLEYLETFSVNPLPVFTAMAGVTRSLLGTRLWMKPEDPPEAHANMAMLGVTATEFCPAPYPPDKPQAPVGNYTAMVMKTVTRSITCPIH